MRREDQETIYSARPRATLTGGWRKGIGAVCLILIAAVAVPAQDEQPAPNAVTFKSLFSFDGADGNVPINFHLAQGTDGNLYGTTFFFGGAHGAGTVFKITPGGTLTTIYNFCAETNCADGGDPNEDGSLALGVDGSLYGATLEGGTSANFGFCNPPVGCGTIFKITPSGRLTTLYNFCSQPNCVDGDTDYSGVVRGADGNFYGTTQGGGVNINAMCSGLVGGGCGSVFKITPAGVFTTIYSFCSEPNCADGDTADAALVSGTDGSLYGVTSGGGANGSGTIFKLTLGGKLTTLHSFGGTDGICGGPGCAPMVQATNGKLYGTAQVGGTNGSGTFFEITPAGIFRTLYNFCSQSNCTDGNLPTGFVQATDGQFYGTTSGGGNSSGSGTVFKITPGGILTTLYSFNGTDGSEPIGLVQATNGIFYGTTIVGGANGNGTVFSLAVGLGPFVETLPTLGKVGDTIQILGTNLTGATSVSFNDTAAAFTVMSKTLISATVPTGATTGFVTVTTPTRTLKSNVKFQVRP